MPMLIAIVNPSRSPPQKTSFSEITYFPCPSLKRPSAGEGLKWVLVAPLRLARGGTVEMKTNCAILKNKTRSRARELMSKDRPTAGTTGDRCRCFHRARRARLGAIGPRNVLHTPVFLHCCC